MSEEARKSSDEEKSPASGLNEMFKGVSSLVGLLGNMLEKIDLSELDEEKLAELRRISETRTSSIPRGGGIPRGVVGFSVQRGSSGAPSVQAFGNIRHTEKGPVVDEVREPLTDIFDEDDYLLVIAELPGVEEEDVQVTVHEETISLSTTTKGRMYSTEVQLPCRVVENESESTYNNGVLEVKLHKFKDSEEGA